MTATIEPPYLVEPYRRTQRAFRERIKGVAPAANTDYAVTMEGRYVTLLESIFCRLTTDGNAANREVVLEYRDAETLRFALFGAGVVVTASSTYDYSFVAGRQESAWPVDTSILVPTVTMPLLPGESFRLHLVNGQAGDTLTLIRYTWERFLTDETR